MVNKYKDREKLSSLIAVRFTEQELARLETAASDQGLGTSTMARLLINQALKPIGQKPRRITTDEFKDVMVATLARLDKEKVESFFKDVSVGNPDDPALLVWAGQTEKWEEFTSLFLKGLLASLGIEVISQENREPNQPPERVNTVTTPVLEPAKSAGPIE